MGTRYVPPLTTRQAAKYLGVSEATMRRWRDDRRGPDWIKYEDSVYRYEVSALEAYKDKWKGRHE